LCFKYKLNYKELLWIKIKCYEKDKTSILKTLQSMDNVIQNHIEELFWNESIEISSKQRYWLIKETEKNI